MNLVVEIGNTALKAAYTEGEVLGKTFRYQGERRIDFIVSIAEREKPDVLVVASAKEISKAETNRLEGICRKLLILDPAHASFLESYGLPSYLTYDRASSIIAAKHLFKGKGCTIVDFGTILSIDIIREDGEYIGGNVSLGCRTRFKAVNRYSRTLPLLETPEEYDSLGQSVQGSIESGIVSGIVFEIKAYLDSYPQNINVFTGGDAFYFVKKMKLSIFAVCNLCLMGLAIIGNEYVQNKIQ